MKVPPILANGLPQMKLPKMHSQETKLCETHASHLCHALNELPHCCFPEPLPNLASPRTEARACSSHALAIAETDKGPDVALMDSWNVFNAVQ